MNGNRVNGIKSVGAHGSGNSHVRPRVQGQQGIKNQNSATCPGQEHPSLLQCCGTEGRCEYTEKQQWHHSSRRDRTPGASVIVGTGKGLTKVSLSFSVAKDKCMCSTVDVALGGRGIGREGREKSKREMPPPSLSTGHSGGPAALLTRIYDHKPIRAEFRVEDQDLRASQFSGAIVWVWISSSSSLGDSKP